MMKHKLIKHFEFEHWSNTMILNALKSLKEKEDRALLLFSHLLSSHSMWLSRVNKTEFTCTLFQERTLEECDWLMKENLQGWQDYLTNKTDEALQEKIEFMSAWEANPSKRSMTVEDALTHIINHSSYHRGQIVASIKGKVDELPLSTYIMYASELL
jgi:uncharacterized damage-inducible protein DinB